MAAEAGERQNIDGEGSAGAGERLAEDSTKRGVHFSWLAVAGRR
jgi:hypothetical protein